MLFLGYGTIFLNPPDHLAVGILGNNLQGSYYIYNNQNYYYCETTGPGFTIGMLPQQFTTQTVNLYPIDVNMQYVPNLEATSLTQPNPTISANPPTIEPVAPISINLIAEEPVLFTLIILAIAVSITITVKTAGNPKQKAPLNQTVSPSAGTSNSKTSDADLEVNKFCIYCGSGNKSCAMYCEKCGKKIG
jgi:hypothetical protein